LIIRDLDQTVKDIDKQAADTKKAGETAAKVEGFRLMKLLKAEIREGAPGGQKFSPLTEMAKIYSYGSRNRTPLKRLSIPVRYRVSRTSDEFAFSLGYMAQDIAGSVKSSNRISKSWARILQLHQEGGTIPIDQDLRRALLIEGARLQKRKNTRGAANVFFLKKSTMSFRIPRREIVDPFWRAHEGEAARNINRNFERKMAGERI